MDDELRNPIKWDRPCYKCGSHYCDLSCSEPTKNDNAAPQEKGMRDILRDTVRSIIAAHSDGDLDVPLAIADLRAALSNNANAAPQDAPKSVDCERCGLTPELHTPTHWCDNQSFQVAAPDPKPVAWMDEFGNTFPFRAKEYSPVGKYWKPLYTAPVAAPDVSTSKTILVGRYIRENGLDSQCFTYPDDLPDGQYKMYLHLDEPVRETAMQTATDDKRDAERYRWLRDHASADWLDSGITDDAVDAVINDKSQWRKKT